MGKLLLGILLLVAVRSTAWPCEYCFISEHGYVFGLNRTLIRIDTRFQLFSGLTNGSTLTDDVSTKYVTTFFTVNYAAGRWGYTLAVPLVYRTQRNTYAGSSSLHYQHTGRVVSTVDSASLETQSVTGMGDATALVRYAVLVQSGEIFASTFLQAGVKMPTGSIGRRDAAGYLLHPHLQAGTGTTVVLIGVSGSYGGVKHSIDGSVLAGIPLQSNGPFREAASFNYDATFHFRLIPDDPDDGPMLIPLLGVIGRVSWKERYKGLEIPDSGGHYMFFNVGLSFLPFPAFSIDLLAQVPMVKNLAGNQLDEQLRLASGVQVSW